MFQPQPAAAQRRHRRLTSGTMVSYAEVKSYLSKREIPQLFESLMAGLMYHRPENHIGYLQTCLDEVKSNSETKVHWSTFVNKKRKSKEILPPLTPPKKQESFSSSWSDNSRQSTPLPPISAKTRTRTNQDLKNTYILYHNPPPILAKPRVPVVSVLGGLGSRIDELCEKVVGRLAGVVHISTCSMLKTRMTIEGFYRVTSVPACAVVDSVLQAMSMVQSANALLVAGFPRSRGDIEEYRSRRVRMDGVVLVDFEEEALRRFLKSEVSSGAIRIGDIESELERYKQDIISVAEYYDEKDILTVVMGDQDTEEMIDDMVMAVDRIIETRKHIQDEDSQMDIMISHDCSDSGPCKSLIPSPNGIERPSTVEIREATEEDIKSIEAASRNSKEDMEVDGKVSESDVPKETGEVGETIRTDVSSEKSGTAEELSKTHEVSEPGKEDVVVGKQSTVPILFAFENIKTDCETLKDLVVNEIGMCYINFYELVRSDGDKNDRLDTNESLNLLQSVLQRDSVSYANGFFISDFPFDLLKESKFEKILKLGDISFVCKVREKSFETEIDETQRKEELLFESPMSEQVRIIFVTEKNIVDELKSSLQEIVSRTDPSLRRNERPIEVENGSEERSVQEGGERTSVSIDKEEKVEVSTEEQDIKQNPSEEDVASKKENEHDSGEINKSPNDGFELIEGNEELVHQESVKDADDLISRDENEDSTCQDVEDIITDDTLDEGTKPRGSLQSDETINENEKEAEMEDTLSQVSEEGAVSIDGCKDKPVLARQQNLDVETTSASESTTQLVKDRESDGEDISKDNIGDDNEAKIKLIRQETFVSAQGTIHESEEPQTDVESNEKDDKIDSNDSKKQEAIDEAKPGSMDNSIENQHLENAVEEKTSENEVINPISTQTSSLHGENDSISVEKNQVDSNELQDKEFKSETSQQAENDASNCEENEAVEAGEKSEKESNENVVQDASVDADQKDTVNSPESIKDETENKQILSEKDTEDLEANSKYGNVEETQSEDVETSIQTENVETVSDEENHDSSIEMKECSDENKSSGQDDESLKSIEDKKVDKAKDELNRSSDETSTDGDSENSQIEATKQEMSSDKEDKAEERTISESKSAEITDVTESNEVSKDNTVCDNKTEDEAHEDKNNDVSEDASTNETDAVPSISKGIDNDSDSNDEKSITIETKAEVHAPDSESPPLVQDIDTIQETEEILETEEVRKIDEVSEVVLELLKKKNNNQETQDVQQKDITEVRKIDKVSEVVLELLKEKNNNQETQDVQQKDIIEVRKIDKVSEVVLELLKEKNNNQETQDVQQTDIFQEEHTEEEQNVEETQSIIEMDKGQESHTFEDTGSIQDSHSTEITDSVHESCSVTENHPAVVENENFIIVDTDAMEEESDLLDCDITSETSHTVEESMINKDIKSETTEESQVTTVQEMGAITNERYSAKIQERNGSGILGDSRHEDHSGGDEPQERSSSSSRGEL